MLLIDWFHHTLFSNFDYYFYFLKVHFPLEFSESLWNAWKKKATRILISSHIFFSKSLWNSLKLLFETLLWNSLKLFETLWNSSIFWFFLCKPCLEYQQNMDQHCTNSVPRWFFFIILGYELKIGTTTYYSCNISHATILRITL